MFSRTSYVLWAVSFGVFLTAVGSSQAAEGPATESPEGSVHLKREQYGTVSGRVNFVRRMTVVPFSVSDGDSGVLPLTICDGRPCVEPKPYWSVVLKDETATYEVSEPFGMGSQEAPKEVSLSGHPVRAGAKITIEGKIDRVSEDFGVVTAIRSVTLLEDGTGLKMGTVRREAISRADSAWICVGKHPEKRGTNLQVQVWYGLGTATSESPGTWGDVGMAFHMRVVEKNRSGAQFREVANLSALEGAFQGRALVYEKSQGGSHARLEIQDADQELFDLSSRFTLVGNGHDLFLEMVCNRDKYF